MRDCPNITLGHKLKLRNSACFALLDFHSQGRVFNNEHNSYPKMSMKRPLDLLLMLINTTSVHFCRFDVLW